jgi:PRTRC genetic system protein E
MFKELRPLIENRPLTLTVVSLQDGTIRVCVVPQSLEKDEATNKRVRYSKEVAKIPDAGIKALTTPLSLTGTPDELDAQLPTILEQYVEKHVGLQQTLDQASAEIEQAISAIAGREKEKTKTVKATKQEEKKDDEKKTDDKKKDVKSPDNGIPSLWCTPASTQAGTDTTQANTAEVQN